MKKDRTDKKQKPATFCAVKRVPGQTDQARFDLLKTIYQQMLVEQELTSNHQEQLCH